ncbi:MAG TPA: hypothetical protein VL308_16930 [Gemmatimonadaceae bacterium]|nr:hypothetical protein [Gemmatimonadaceae bacterium]
MKSVARFVAALVALFALYSIRAWFVLAGAFFGVMLLRGKYAMAHDGDDWPGAILMLVMGLWLLRISYGWFAVRWREATNSEPPA